jgi:hypothetical protein
MYTQYAAPGRVTLEMPAQPPAQDKYARKRHVVSQGHMVFIAILSIILFGFVCAALARTVSQRNSLAPTKATDACHRTADEESAAALWREGQKTTVGLLAILIVLYLCIGAFYIARGNSPGLNLEFEEHRGGARIAFIIIVLVAFILACAGYLTANSLAVVHGEKVHSCYENNHAELWFLGVALFSFVHFSYSWFIEPGSQVITCRRLMCICCYSPYTSPVPIACQVCDVCTKLLCDGN